MAHPSTDGRKRIFFFDELQSFLVLALSHQSHITLDRNVGWTANSARRSAVFFDGKGSRNRLGVATVDGFALAETQIKFVFAHHRTHRNAIAAARALVRVNKTRLLRNFHPEITRFPGNLLHLCQCQQFDVGMTADLDQFRRDDSHGTFIGGESFI